ncbi:MAG: hypothetical protein IPJ90_21960 [Anaerolineaceae bacterium]|nr:hypothetical protein [Anaerolineaceae bacterium]
MSFALAAQLRQTLKRSDKYFGAAAKFFAEFRQNESSLAEFWQMDAKILAEFGGVFSAILTYWKEATDFLGHNLLSNPRLYKSPYRSKLPQGIDRFNIRLHLVSQE